MKKPGAKSRAQPVYARIANQMRAEIAKGFKPGDILPAETELAQRFEVNRHTMRRAMEELVSDGLVIRQPGRGTTVINNHINYEISPRTRFTETIESLGRHVRSQLLGKRLLHSVGGVAVRLGLPEGAPIVHIETLREVDDLPMAVVSHFFPAARLEGLIRRYEGGSLHRLIESEFGITLRRTESLITAVLPTEEDAMMLRLPVKLPVLRVKNLNMDEATGDPIEYAIARFRSDRMQFKISL